jgi:hypothetical protein
MEKLSGVEVQQVLRLGAEALEKLAGERDALRSENRQLRAKLAQHELNHEVSKLAGLVHERGLDQGRTLEETKVYLLGKAAEGKLELFKQALELSTAQRSPWKVGDMVTGGAKQDFDSFVMSGE